MHGLLLAAVQASAKSSGSPLLWGGFAVFVVTVLALDLGVFHRKAHEVRPREALVWSAVWIGLALLFNVGVALDRGREAGLQFLTGYLIEEALSVDNLFVFMVVFSYFSVPKAYQHRVLFWGIVGALVMRGIFIWAGIELMDRFHILLLLLGGFLVFTGVRILLQRHEEVHPERNLVLRLFRRFVPMTPDYDGHRFLVRRDGRTFATPLLMVLVVVEVTDVIFAVDSIPAILAVTQDPFIVYTSNIFAILGLRSLYFSLAGFMDRFHYLKVGLGLILVFVGFKMAAKYWKMDLPILVSLGVIVALLAGSIVASLLRPQKAPPAAPPGTPP
ncbi:MAG TPA: TerC family protein [Planctomycetota bacterium]